MSVNANGITPRKIVEKLTTFPCIPAAELPKVSLQGKASFRVLDSSPYRCLSRAAARRMRGEPADEGRGGTIVNAMACARRIAHDISGWKRRSWRFGRNVRTHSDGNWLNERLAHLAQGGSNAQEWYTRFRWVDHADSDGRLCGRAAARH
jgi:hypothetical protein